MARSTVLLLLFISLAQWMLLQGADVQEVAQQQEGEQEMEHLLEKMYGDDNAENEEVYDNPDILKQHFFNYVTKRLSDFTASKRFSEFMGGKKKRQWRSDGERDKKFSEFMGGKKRFSEFIGGKKRFSEFMGGK